MKSNRQQLMTYSTEQSILDVLQAKDKFILFAEYVHHDQDEAEPHWHINLKLTDSRETAEVSNWFKKCLDDKGQVANTFSEPVRDADKAHRYLRHLDDLDKHQYEETDVKIIKGNVEEFIIKDEKPNDVGKMIDDIMERKSWRYMAETYGRDYMKNFKAYRNYANMISLEETGEMRDDLLEDQFQVRQNQEVQKIVADVAYRATEYTTSLVMDYFNQKFGCDGYITKEFKEYMKNAKQRND